jgi:hypothetical protein
MTCTADDVAERMANALKMIQDFSQYPPDDARFDFLRVDSVRKCSIKTAESQPGKRDDAIYDHVAPLNVFWLSNKLLAAYAQWWNESALAEDRQVKACILFLAHEFYHIPQGIGSEVMTAIGVDEGWVPFLEFDYEADLFALDVCNLLIPTGGTAAVLELLELVIQSSKPFSILDAERADKGETLELPLERVRRTLSWVFHYVRVLQTAVAGSTYEDCDLITEPWLYPTFCKATVTPQDIRTCASYILRIKNRFGRCYWISLNPTQRGAKDREHIVRAVFEGVVDGQIGQGFRPFFEQAGETLRINRPIPPHTRQESANLLQTLRRDVELLNDDAFLIGRLDGQYTDAILRVPNEVHVEHYEFDGTTEHDPIRQSGLVAHWMKPYFDDVTTFVEGPLDDSIHNAKVALARWDGSSLGRVLPIPAITVCPINHWVTERFNRELARVRLGVAGSGPRKVRAHEVWSKCGENFFANAQFAELKFPSQLFVELAVITSDGFVILPKKSGTNSVYAQRAGGQVHTCGIEIGPDWRECIGNNPSNPTNFNLEPAVWNGLKRELALARVDEQDQDCLGIELKELVFDSLWAQMIHLNSAILGYCVLSLDLQTLSKHLLKLGKRGGLIFARQRLGPDIDSIFIGTLDDHETMEELNRRNWHGTALARLEIAKRDFRAGRLRITNRH